jgi:hypothetical protein
MHQFARGREQVEDARRSGRHSDFICQSRIQAAQDEMPNASAQRLAEISHYSSSTVFYVLAFVFRLKLQHWKWIPHFLSDDDTAKRMSMAQILGNFVDQSATTKLDKLLDRGRGADYVG